MGIKWLNPWGIACGNGSLNERAWTAFKVDIDKLECY